MQTVEPPEYAFDAVRQAFAIVGQWKSYLKLHAGPLDADDKALLASDMETLHAALVTLSELTA